MGEFICKYDGKLCSYGVMKKKKKEYEKLGAGSYILKFKFKEKWWAIDATMEDGSIGRLINHSKKFQNVKPVVGHRNGMPFIYVLAVSDICKDDEILYDYGDNSKDSKINFPWLRE